ncbi:MAG: hypothetical protein ACRD1T_10880 [Acidimicrobiia bacterium]
MTERLEKAQILARLPGRVAAVLGAGLFVMALAPDALAYVGPGAGLGMLGALLAVIVAVLATVVGLVLWPLRMLTRRRKNKAGTAGEPESGSAPRQSKEVD